jgi:hypothetical protein
VDQVGVQYAAKLGTKSCEAVKTAAIEAAAMEAAAMEAAAP